MSNTAIEIFANVIAEQQNKQSQSVWWDKGHYSSIDSLKPDYSGKAGELLAKSLCETLGIKYSYDEDIVDQDDGTYDITIKGTLVEIKTARVGCYGDNFQHESLRDYGCDHFMFIDVTPHNFYLSIFPSDFDFRQKHPIFGRTPHLRKGSDGIYKFDLSLASLKKGINAGVTLLVNDKTSDGNIRDFINKRIV
tara:strand:+ start:3522 stop:4100 length:579 start_codon:yes stop_codon:yes gene_type:complete